jgi:hypothetical protein
MDLSESISVRGLRSEYHLVQPETASVHGWSRAPRNRDASTAVVSVGAISRFDRFMVARDQHECVEVAVRQHTLGRQVASVVDTYGFR